MKNRIIGSIFIIMGIFLFLGSSSYFTTDYTINAFDAIFVIPMLIKIMGHELSGILADFGGLSGLLAIVGGIICIKSAPETTENFSDTPTEKELQKMLKSGEITREEYNEIRQYASQQSRK